MKPRSVPSEGHNDLDEGFIDECESTHSNHKNLEKMASGSQDVPDSNIGGLNQGPNTALLKSAGKAFR